MTTRKTTLAAVGIAAVTFAAGPAMAGGLSQDTASFAFDSSNEIAATEQVAKLSEKEMKETKGEYGLYGAVGGGIVGGASYTAGTFATDNVSWNVNDFTRSTLGGAAAGTFGGLGATGTAGTAARSTARETLRFGGSSSVAGGLWDAGEAIYDSFDNDYGFGSAY